MAKQHTNTGSRPTSSHTMLILSTSKRKSKEHIVSTAQLDALREVLKTTEKARDKMGAGASMILRGLIEQREKFDTDKKRIEDDIKRGARTSRGQLPR